MDEKSGKVFHGKENQKEFDKQNQPLGMGEIQPPTGLPENIKSLVITFDINNQNLQVAGPIDLEVMCFGMMEKAKLLIYEHNKSRQKISTMQKDQN